MPRMKRVVWFLVLGLALLGPGRLTGAGPDDDFLRIYNLIQQGDTFYQNSRLGEARARYSEALRLLQEFERNYPGWNESLIRFRKQYLQERIGAPAPPPAPAPAAPAGRPAPPENAQIAALQEQLQLLAAERDLLQARLREALAAQPAAADPRELTRAQERIGTLQREIEQLRAEIVARDARLAEAGSLQNQLAEARQALDAARQTLAQQNETVTALNQKLAALQRQLEEARSRPAAPAADPAALARSREELEAARRRSAELQQRVADLEKQLASRPAATEPEATGLRRELEQTRRQNLELKQRVADLETRVETSARQLEALRAEKTALERRLAEAPARAPETAPRAADSVAAPQLTELRQQVEKLRQELATERWRAENFKTEKELLEKRVAELTANATRAAAPTTSIPAVAPATSTNPPPAAPATPPADPKREKVLAKYQREADKARIRQLERDREELNKRIRVLSRQLEDLRRQTAGTSPTPGGDQLAILRARLEAYESRAVPYTPEELALFKQTAGVPGATTNTAEVRDSRRALRQIPAGAATLLSEAQRAFQLRRYDEAERKLAQALQLDERNVDMLTYLAAAQLEQDRQAETEATLQRVLALDPNNADGISLLGLLRFRQSRYDEAFDLLSRAAQLNPDNPYTQNYLGVTLGQRGQRGAAENALRRAVALDPNYGEAHANLATLYALARPPALELARYHYQKALGLGQPRNPELERRLESAGAQAGSTNSPRP